MGGLVFRRFFLIAFILLGTLTTLAQQQPDIANSQGFDEVRLRQIIESEKIPKDKIEAFVARLKQNYLEQQKSTFQPFFQNKIKNSNNTPQSNAYCPNADFESQDFSGWVGYAFSFRLPNGAGIVTAGPNASLNTLNAIHTILTTPPTNNNTANGPLVGYDSIAIPVGSTISEIPWLAPDGGKSSVRLGNSNAGLQFQSLKYSMSISAQNKLFTYKYALVLSDGGHALNDQPYFKVYIKDAAGQIIGGNCGYYFVTAKNADTDSSFIKSKFDLASDAIYFKKWTTVSVDLTAYIGQTLSIEFQTRDCTFAPHWGYAYIDADCNNLKIKTKKICGVNNMVSLIAPPGFVSYQWQGPNNFTNIIGATNDTLIFTNPTVGDTFRVLMNNVTNCQTIAQVVIDSSMMEVKSIQSTPTCNSGHSGTATVSVNGDAAVGYNYIWTTGPNQTGIKIGTSQTIKNLASGTYYVHVNSSTCPIKDTFVVVQEQNINYQPINKTFCGKNIKLDATPGTNYQWYNSSGSLIPAGLGGNSNSLQLSNAIHGQAYAVTYMNTTGCKDSVKYTLQKDTLFTVSTTISHSCTGVADGGIQLTNQALTYAPYNYNWTNGTTLNGYSTSPATNISITGLAIGTYTVNTISTIDSTCKYTVTLKIDQAVITPSYVTKWFCTGASTMTITAPSGTNYQWYNNYIAVLASAGGNNNSINANALNNQVYSVSYINVSGCKDSIRYTLLLQNPSFTSTLTSGNCFGSNGAINLINQTPAYAPYNYTWTNGKPIKGISSSPATNIYLTSLPVGTYTVNAVSTIDSNCRYIDTLKIIAGSVPAPIIDSIYLCPNAGTFIIPPDTLKPNHHWYSQSLSQPAASINNLGVLNDSLYVSAANGLNKEGVLYIDSILTTQGCMLAYKTHINRNAINIATPAIVNNLCNQDTLGSVSVSVNNIIAPTGQGLTYTWAGPFINAPQPSTTANPPSFPNTTSIHHLAAGTYTLTVTSGGCTTTLTVTLSDPPPIDSLPLTAKFCAGDKSGELIAPAGLNNYQWFTVSYTNGVKTETLIPNQTGNTLSLSDPDTYQNYSATYFINGCRVHSFNFVRDSSGTVFLPELGVNVFTPNGDGNNDNFMPFYNSNVSQDDISDYAGEFSVKIHDRWGNLVFTSNNYLNAWDGKYNGKDLDEGTYFWIATYKVRCGNETTTKNGFVQLIR